MVSNQGFDSSKYLTKNNGQAVDLIVTNDCYVCEMVDNSDCDAHNGYEDTIPIRVRRIPWSKKNQLVAQCIRWSESGNTVFDADLYMRESLKYMIVEAPWGATNDVFLSQVDMALGTALESIVPKANNASSNRTSVAEVKKEL